MYHVLFLCFATLLRVVLAVVLRCHMTMVWREEPVAKAPLALSAPSVHPGLACEVYCRSAKSLLLRFVRRCLCWRSQPMMSS